MAVGRYTVELTKRLEPYDFKWIEEPLMPDEYGQSLFLPTPAPFALPFDPHRFGGGLAHPAQRMPHAHHHHHHYCATITTRTRTHTHC